MIRAKKAEQENEYLTGVVINSELEKEEAIELAEKALIRRFVKKKRLNVKR